MPGLSGSSTKPYNASLPCHKLLVVSGVKLGSKTLSLKPIADIAGGEVGATPTAVKPPIISNILPNASFSCSGLVTKNAKLDPSSVEANKSVGGLTLPP